ncbi:glycosyltransferase [Microbacterium timonense]|uniref:glycosyltransferase n=1 Tax=Microbacterium timonense TaxID=2086576 RepID=UPI00135AB9C3|nr:glycosyltransferase [Microbacterium timonense]
MTVDLTVVITTHAEDHLLRPTMRAIHDAIEAVTDAGYRVELLMVADNPTPAVRSETARWTHESRFESRVLEVALGEPGASRNAGVRAAKGTYIALCDGDDLFTADMLLGAVRILDERGRRAIVHPEHVVSFGERSALWPIRSTDDPSLTYRDLLTSNLWPSCSVSPRELLLEFPYPELPPGSGYGPEDYFWNVVTASAGIPHVTVPGSFHFYRTRRAGGVNNANASALLPPFDLDALRANFPRVETPTTPATLAQRARRGVAQAYHVLKPIARPVPFTVRRRVYRMLRSAIGKPMWSTTALDAATTARIRRVAEIEPALSWTLYHLERDEVHVWRPVSDAYADILEALWDGLRGRCGLVMLAPWVGIGGADLVVQNYANAFIARSDLADQTALITTADAFRTDTDLIPAGMLHHQLPESYRKLPHDRQRQLIAQAIILLKPATIISVNCFDFSRALNTYGSQLCTDRRVYLTFFAFDRIGRGSYPTNPITDDAGRLFTSRLAGVITDNHATAALVADTMGIDDTVVKVHRQPAMRSIPEFESIAQGSAYIDEQFSAERPFEVVWPHRMDREKRVDSLVKIAEEVRRRGLAVRINVHGSAVLHAGDPDLRPQLRRLGVVVHGPYKGGLPALPVDRYHCMLLTSESEGLPLSIVQAMHLGLPVIASAVGGVGDIVKDRETGLLTTGPDDITGFVDAIAALAGSRELRRTLIRGGYDFARANHSVEAFEALVREEFGTL